MRLGLDLRSASRSWPHDNCAGPGIRLLFDENGALLNPQDWPDEIASSVEAVDLKNRKVKLASKLAARRIILEQTGKLKRAADGGLDALAEAMRANLARYSKT